MNPCTVCGQPCVESNGEYWHADPDHGAYPRLTSSPNLLGSPLYDVIVAELRASRYSPTTNEDMAARLTVTLFDRLLLGDLADLLGSVAP